MPSTSLILSLVALNVCGLLAVQANPLPPIGMARRIESPRDSASGLPSGQRMHKPFVVARSTGDPDDGGEFKREPTTNLSIREHIAQLVKRLAGDPDSGGEAQRRDAHTDTQRRRDDDGYDGKGGDDNGGDDDDDKGGDDDNTSTATPAPTIIAGPPGCGAQGRISCDRRRDVSEAKRQVTITFPSTTVTEPELTIPTQRPSSSPRSSGAPLFTGGGGDPIGCGLQGRLSCDRRDIAARQVTLTFGSSIVTLSGDQIPTAFPSHSAPTGTAIPTSIGPGGCGGQGRISCDALPSKGINLGVVRSNN